MKLNFPYTIGDWLKMRLDPNESTTNSLLSKKGNEEFSGRPVTHNHDS